MTAIDLTKFIWVSKESKQSHLVLAVTKYGSDDVIVHRESKDRGSIYVASVSDFCSEFDATYELP